MSKINVKINKNIFSDKFYPELFNYSSRWNVYYGGAGSGKSYFIAQKLIVKALKEERRTLVVRRFGTSLRNSVYQLFKDVLKDFGMSDDCRITDSMLSITLPNGSAFIFMGADDEEKLLSIQDISDVFYEEATEGSRDLLEQLSLRMRGKASNHQIHLAFNPIAKSNYLYQFVEENPPRSFIKIHSTYKDNKFLPASYVEAMGDLYRTNPKKAKVFCDGDWGTTGELVFQDNWEVQDFDVRELVKRGYPVRFGGDFGFTLDPTAVVGTIYDVRNKTIYVFDEIYKRGMLNSDIAEELRKRRYDKQIIYFDSAEPKSIVELGRMNIKVKPAKKGKDSIKFGVAFLQGHKIIISPRCAHLIQEFKGYQHKKDKQTGEYLVDKFEGVDHGIDALRYAYSEIYKSSQFKTISKYRFGL